MRVLITGATGFLGRHVVAEAVRRGHHVTALVRPSHDLDDSIFPSGVTVVRGDLRSAASLTVALKSGSSTPSPDDVGGGSGIEAVVHLAACVVGDDDAQFASTVVGTENLLAAMAAEHVTRLIHCSTFSVYDWQQARRKIDESSPLEADLYARDGYAISKTWQERIVRRVAAEHGWELTVLRPGFLWGAGSELIAGTGHSFGRWHVVLGVGRTLPLSYVENCAECFVRAMEAPAAIAQTYNVVDSEKITAWQYMGTCLAEGVVQGHRLPVPYWTGLAVAQLVSGISRLLFGPTAKLPGLLVPTKFRARFRPLRFPNQAIRVGLGWQPKWSFRSAWQRTVGRGWAEEDCRQSASRRPTFPTPSNQQRKCRPDGVLTTEGSSTDRDSSVAGARSK